MATLNKRARELSAQIGLESLHPIHLDASLAGGRLADEFLKGLRDGMAVPDELTCAVGLLGKAGDETLTWFLRALQVRIQRLQQEAANK